MGLQCCQTVLCLPCIFITALGKKEMVAFAFCCLAMYVLPVKVCLLFLSVSLVKYVLRLWHFWTWLCSPFRRYHLRRYMAGRSVTIHRYTLMHHDSGRPRWLNWMRRSTGDQEVAGSTLAEVGNILSWRLIMKYFLRSFSPFRWFKKGSCQFLAKECAQYWLTA